jgi:putative ABC transport system substrate-binding protein
MRICLRRREFIAGLGGAAAAWPLVVRAQARGLRDLGWTEGRNLRIEYRGIAGGGIDRIRAVVTELVASNPDVAHATITPIVQELRRQTRSIPIIFANITDPVENRRTFLY